MCYRYEQITARSEIQFHQVEGLAVGPQHHDGRPEGHDDRVRPPAVRPASRRTRFRAAYFPFTEPSVEVDIDCFVCAGTGCPVCKRTGWLEILGAAWSTRRCCATAATTRSEFSGFAFGMGPQRITMLKHRIDDIRYFWANDLRFLEQF